jgi:sulfide:quinone oxidoreductase
MVRAMSPADHRIIIAGAGIAGLEALLALRVLAGPRARITLVTDAVHEEDRPMSVVEPFDRGIASKRDIVAIAADQDADLHFDRLVGVDIERRVARFAGQDRPYDALIVATGAHPEAQFSQAVTFRGPSDVPAMRAVRDELLSGAASSAAFVIPSMSAWPLPLYELALMTGADVRAHGRGAELTIVTPEKAPMELFGPAAAEALRPLLAQRGVAVRTNTRVVDVRDGVVTDDAGGQLQAERVVAVPIARGRPPAGLASDRRGFLLCDAHGRVVGAPGVYAAGDVTAFPLKQGGLAAQQADAVAEAIAADMGAAIEPQPFVPVIRGMLLIGGQALYLRAQVGADEGVVEEVRVRGHASTRPLWWPPAKVAARYLGPYLATARPPRLGVEPLTDRPAPGPAAPPADPRAAVELALTMADADAHWGDFDAAVRALDAAQAAGGTLPPDYARKRERWLLSR